jgi:fructokinase
MALLGAVEAGGTKFICAVGSGPHDLVRTTIPTTTPGETLGHAIQFFRDCRTPAAALGVASFGPVDLDPQSRTFGFITSTPKPGWSNVDICGILRRGLPASMLDGPIAFDTDVNGAALAEAKWGAAQGLDNILYLTVGTGIGGGALVGGSPVHGLSHPEMGHMLIPRIPDDRFAGACPFHGDCFEGLASGLAMELRWGVKAEALSPDHPAWRLQARYLAMGLANLVCGLSPRRIVIGGGVMRSLHLLPMIRESLRDLLNGYVRVPEIMPPLLGGDAGVLGGIALAERAVIERSLTV